MKAMRFIASLFCTSLVGMLFFSGAFAESMWTTYLSPMNILSSAREGNVVWCGTDTGLYRLNLADGSYTAVADQGGPSGKVVMNVCLDKAGNKWLGTDDGVMRFDGNAWTTYRIGDNLTYNDIWCLTVRPDNSVWAGVPAGTYTFNGEKWSLASTEFGTAQQFVNASDGSLWIVDHMPYLYRFDGTSWTKLDPYTGFHFEVAESMAFAPDGSLWIGTWDQGLGHASNGVYTIYTKENGLPDNKITKLMADSKGVVWAGIPSYGIARIEGGVITVFNSQNGLAGDKVNSISIDSTNEVWVATDHGLSRFKTTDSPVGVNSDPSLPRILALTGNYPNPFNPSTTISFILPSSGTANLSVFDITGSKVRSLVSGSMQAGAHSVVWDGRDERGVLVSSGVYLSRLESGKTAVTAKMLMVK